MDVAQFIEQHLFGISLAVMVIAFVVILGIGVYKSAANSDWE
jgi:hypothetical protein